MFLSINHGMHSLRIGKERFTAVESAKFLAGIGFEGLDVNFFASTNTGIKREKLLDNDWKQNICELKDVIRANNLKVESIHTPSEHFYINNPDLKSEYEEKTFLSLEAAGILGAKYAVIHPVRNHNLTETLVEESIRIIEPYRDYAKQFGVEMAVENLPCTSADELIQIADALGCVCCWDTGHANLRAEDQAESIKKVGKRIHVTHIHDNSGKEDEHNPPFMGNINWESVMKALHDIGYQGFLNFEVLTKPLPEPLHTAYATYTLNTGKYLLSLFERSEPENR